MSIKVSHLSVCKSSLDFNQYEHDLNQLLHDIKSPISSLNLCVRHLENRGHELTKTEAFPILKLALERLNSLVSKSPAINTFNIPDILNSVASEVRFCNSINIHLHELPASLASIIPRGDADTFKTILFNIINNSINAKSTQMNIVASESPTGVTIKFQDNGKGIEKNLIQYIGKTGFSFQDSNSSSAGQGLGLSHAAETINSWGGSLTITSEVNKGTDVSIFLLKK